MPLQIRRGTNAERENMTVPLAPGEPLYTTDEKSLYVGDGITLGGVRVSAGYQDENAVDAVATALVNGVNSNIQFVYGPTQDFANRIDAVIDLSLYSGEISADGFRGSLFANDSSLLIDADTGSIILDGTVKGNIIPDQNEVYDIGSITNRFRDLYLSGSSLWLGDAQLTATGSAINLPAGTTIGGLAVGMPGGDLNVNIIGDDSTVIVNTTNKTVIALGGFFGNITGNVTGNVLGNLTGDVLGNLTGNVLGDLYGNVFGDVLGNLTGDVLGNVNGNVTGDLTGNVLGNLTGNVTGNVTGNLTGNVTGDLTGNVLGNLTGNVSGNLTGNVSGNLSGNVIGSVISDDGSTIILNGTNNSINASGGIFGNLTGNVIGNLSGNVIGNLSGNVSATTISTLFLDGDNSSEITVRGALRVQSDLTIENEIFADNGIIGNITVTGTIIGNIRGLVQDNNGDAVLDTENKKITLNEIILEGTSSITGQNIVFVSDTIAVVASTPSLTEPTLAALVISPNNAGGSLSLTRARGNILAPAIVENGDEIGSLEYGAFNGNGFVSSANLKGIVDGTVTFGQPAPIKLDLNISNGTAVVPVATFKPTQVEFTAVPIVPNLTSIQRDALTPQFGMMIYNTTNNKFQGYQDSSGGEWVDLS